MLKHGILGILNYGDMSGYEIREVFNDSLNYFWTAHTSQIYRELDVLEKNGWIKKQEVEQDGRPNKTRSIKTMDENSCALAIGAGSIEIRSPIL